MKISGLPVLVLTTGLLAASSSFAETADEAMANIMQAGPVALPPAPPAPIGVEVYEIDDPKAHTTVSATAPTLLAELDMTKLEEKGYTLVPAPDRPKSYADMSYGEKIASICASSVGHISFDCAESPSIALLNIADQNRTKSPATYWIVGALGMILGAILLIPALAIALVSGGAKVIHDIATGS
ncbi:MAG: hypothetical protein HY923_06345 [Elusimicrobia bacterium]|nr:hypothetical protein [Elusimicrobiota bacterium]